MRQDQQEMDKLKGKLNVLSGVLRMGHEAFQKKSPAEVASHIVNNSRLLLDYVRSAVVDLRGLSPAVLAVSGQPSPKQDSEYCAALRRLVAALPPCREPVSLKAGDTAQGPSAAEALATIFEGLPKAEMLILPLREPGVDEPCPAFVWVVEFPEGAPSHALSVLSLLSQHYEEALWHRAALRPGAFDALLRLRELPPVKLAFGGAVALLIILFAVRVRQCAVADFEIVPTGHYVCYSQIEGTLRHVVKGNGEAVSAGDAVLEFDREELEFRLAKALKDFEQVSAEFDSTRQKSFSSQELIAKAQLLEIKRDQDAIEMERMRWMLSKSLLRAEVAGVVSMDDRERMEGRYVKPGEKLFEVIPPDKFVAEIALSERDASVIGKGTTVSLYLHTQPETPIWGELLSVAPKPVLTADRKYCYILRLKPDSSKGLICGMRGVARVGGERVSLGYHIFRSVVLWWRKI